MFSGGLQIFFSHLLVEAEWGILKTFNWLASAYWLIQICRGCAMASGVEIARKQFELENKIAVDEAVTQCSLCSLAAAGAAKYLVFLQSGKDSIHFRNSHTSTNDKLRFAIAAPGIAAHQVGGAGRADDPQGNDSRVMPTRSCGAAF